MSVKIDHGYMGRASIRRGAVALLVIGLLSLPALANSGGPPYLYTTTAKPATRLAPGPVPYTYVQVQQLRYAMEQRLFSAKLGCLLSDFFEMIR